MRSINSSFFFRVTFALLFVGASIAGASRPAHAQTMGEYGAVTARVAGASAGASSATLPPPQVHANPMLRGSSESIEVSGQVREDDSAAGAKVKDDDSNKTDEWTEVK
jgi:hypothetical protein